MAFAPLYAYAGRFAEARAAMADSRGRWADSGAGFLWAICAHPAGLIEMIAGDAVAAERELRGGYEALREVGERGFRASIAALLAEAVYAQGRLAEAQQLTDEAAEIAVNGDIDAHVRWRAIGAKLLARRGQFQAARKLADEALALIPASTWVALLAEMLMTKAEVLRLAGANPRRPGTACGRRWPSTPNVTPCPWPSGRDPRWPASAPSPGSGRAGCRNAVVPAWLQQFCNLRRQG